MSFIDLLFPLEQLEDLGNKWPGPAPKRRKLDSGAGQGQGQSQARTLAPPRRQQSDIVPGARHHRHSTSSYHHVRPLSSTKSNVSAVAVKRSYSDSQPSSTTRRIESTNTTGTSASTSTNNAASTSTTATTPAVKSFLPSFIEPSILKNYLQHLHPNDRPRYSLPNSPKPEVEEPQQVITTHYQHNEDSAPSPASLMTDTSSPSSSVDHCPTPSAGIYEQLRGGPFGHLIDGLRLTDHERTMMNDLLDPERSLDLVSDLVPSTKRKADCDAMELRPQDFYEIDEGLLQRMFPPPVSDRKTLELAPQRRVLTNADRDADVHSSGLSPGPEEEEESHKTPAGIVMYDYSALSVDEFFDLDEAASASSPLAI